MTEETDVERGKALAPTRRRNQMLAGLAVGVAAVGTLSGAYWWLHASHFISTHNAYAAVEVAQVTPSVAGVVLNVLVEDTQAVKKGEVLVRIDPTDAQLALAQAEAELAMAVRRVQGYAAHDRGLKAQIAARVAEQKSAAAQLASVQADMLRASIDLQRREALARSGSVSGDELTQAQNAFAAAKARLAAAHAAQAQARAHRQAAEAAERVNATLLEKASGETHPEVKLARARRDQARLDLQRTTLRASMDGIVAQRNVQMGQRVAPGAALMAIVPVQQMHVNANFKEGQLGRLRLGQRVQLRADLYGSDVTYTGTVEGLSGGSGAAFAAIPAQNASGNWIKVVQRLPVRIALKPEELAAHPLRVGLSMRVTVDARPDAEASAIALAEAEAAR